MFNAQEIGNLIKHEREEMGESLESFAGKIGVARQTLSKWEKGSASPSVNDLEHMCKGFDCDFGYLVGEYSCKRRPVTDIHAETGLSSETIKILCERNNGLISKNASFLEILSTIIVHGFYLGTLYEEYKTAANKHDNRYEFYKQMKQKCDDIEMSKKEFYELLESDAKETEFKIILEISKIVQRGYRNGKHKEN